MLVSWQSSAPQGMTWEEIHFYNQTPLTFGHKYHHPTWPGGRLTATVWLVATLYFWLAINSLLFWTYRLEYIYFYVCEIRSYYGTYAIEENCSDAVALQFLHINLCGKIGNIFIFFTYYKQMFEIYLSVFKYYIIKWL